MKMYIARDKCGSLWLYESEPIRQGEWFVPTCFEDCKKLHYTLFPEVTFENSPMEVELKLVNNVQGE